MPKQIYTLNDFSGGINDVKDPRDIQPNELPVAKNVAVDQQGALRTIGKVSAHSDIEDKSSTKLAGGYGLIYMEADVTPKTSSNDQTANLTWAASTRQVSNNSDSFLAGFTKGSKVKVTGSANNDGIFTTADSYTDSGVHTLVFNESVTDETDSTGVTTTFVETTPDAKIVLISNAQITGTSATIEAWDYADGVGGSSGWLSSAAVTVNSDSRHEAPNIIYYNMNGATRIIDTNFNNRSKIQWYGYVERTHFDETNGDKFFAYYANDNTLTPPTQADEGTSYPSAGTGFEVDLTDSGSTGDGLWEAEEYEIAASFIYDGNQESLLFQEAGGTFTPAGDKRLSAKIYAKGSYDERITGGRVYIRKTNSIGSTEDEWSMLADIDFQRGVRGSFSDDFTTWTYEGSNKEFHATVVLDAPNFDTYTSINGYSHDEYFNDFGDNAETAATATVLNNRVFLGNVRVKNPTSGNMEYFGDRIMFTPVGKYDTFPESFNIDVVKGDADTYVRLDGFADRLLCFKNYSMQIVNIASNTPSGWFLEENLQRLGVAHHNAVVRTEFGIAWANKYGCYFYDGRIRNFSQNKIDDDTWESHITSNSILGYDSIKKQLFVVDDATSPSDVYVYDFKTKSWVLGYQIFGTDPISNIVTDYNNDLVFISNSGTTSTFKKWGNTSANNGSIEFRTKDIDFGDPSTMKKVYAVYATYKSSAEQQLPLEFAINGTGSFSDFSTSTNIQPQGNSGGAGYLESSTSWDIATFTADTIKSCQSIQFKFLPPSSGTFNINDISIEYRLIRNKRVS